VRCPAERFVQPGFPGPVARQVQDLVVCGVRDPGRGVDQAGAQGCSPGAGVGATGESAGGAGEVVGDRGADQAGGIRGESA
jgi:hypothetical protein